MATKFQLQSTSSTFFKHTCSTISCRNFYGKETASKSGTVHNNHKKELKILSCENVFSKKGFWGRRSIICETRFYVIIKRNNFCLFFMPARTLVRQHEAFASKYLRLLLIKNHLLFEFIQNV